jgi:hypothetical protein
MAKKKFSSLVSTELMTKNRNEEQELLKEKFQEFLQLETPKEVSAYEWKGYDVLIKVFKLRTKNHSMEDIEGESLMSNTRFFSIAKILAAGPDSKYEEGDLVKLKDVDTLTIESSQYRDWIKNEFSKGNLKQKGTEPSRFVSNIYQTFGPNAFILNPLDIISLDKEQDDSIFKVNDGKIENKINNVDILI